MNREETQRKYSSTLYRSLHFKHLLPVRERGETEIDAINFPWWPHFYTGPCLRVEEVGLNKGNCQLLQGPCFKSTPCLFDFARQDLTQ